MGSISECHQYVLKFIEWKVSHLQISILLMKFLKIYQTIVPVNILLISITQKTEKSKNKQIRRRRIWNEQQSWKKSWRSNKGYWLILNQTANSIFPSNTLANLAFYLMFMWSYRVILSLWSLKQSGKINHIKSFGFTFDRASQTKN